MHVFILTFWNANSPGLSIMKPFGNFQIGCTSVYPEDCFTMLLMETEKNTFIQPQIDPNSPSSVAEGVQVSLLQVSLVKQLLCPSDGVATVSQRFRFSYCRSDLSDDAD